MSGLVALFHRDGRPVEQAAIETMLAAVPYRGPDGMWTRLFDTVALGHAKLSVTPEEEAERQPLLSPRTGCALIADARLDNRAELLAQLPDRPSPTVSDGELILRAYEAWGIDAPAHLLGDFAFAVWDPRHQRFVCARDTGGERPLFYRVDRRTFAAASEIHQLFQDASVAVVPNERRIREFLVPLNVFRVEKDAAATFYEGIWAVPAGHVLVVDREAVRVWRYWDLAPPREIRYRSDGEYAEHFRALLFDAVRARLRTSRPLGALLSGGLDSSSVVCTAHELFRRGEVSNPGLVGLSLVFDSPECDERHFIRDMQVKHGFEVRYVSPGTFVDRLQLEPDGFRQSPILGVTERDAAFLAASRAGVRAVLTGDVADAVVGGSRLVFDSLLRHGRLGAFRRHLGAYRRSSGESLRKTLAVYCLGPLLPLGLQARLVSRYLRQKLENNRARLLPSWIPEPLREELSSLNIQLCVEAERGRRFSSEARQLEYSSLYPPGVTSSPLGWPLECWSPFADRRLHEFLLAVPPEQKFEPHPDTDEFYAGSKRLVRRAMQGILPESIRTRTSKTHFGSVFEDEVRRRWPRYEAAFGPAGTPEVAARGYVDQQLFWLRLQELRAGPRGRDLLYVRGVVLLESWLRTFRLPRPQLVTFPTQWRRPEQAIKRYGHAMAPLGVA